MTSFAQRLNRLTRRSFVLLCIVVAFAIPAAAFAGSNTYASGTNGIGGNYAGPGLTSMLYNQVWHQSGWTWEVYYDYSGQARGDVEDNMNPTKWPYSISGYSEAHCHNINDTSGVTWTCQYGS